MSARTIRRLLGAAVLVSPASAFAQQSQTFVDLEAGLGYSGNPLVVSGDDSGSTFGRVSAFGFHGWSTERSSTSLTAYVENSSYFRRFGNRQAFSLGANTSLAASEKLNVFGGVGFSGDFGGQLSSRLFQVPALTTPTTPTTPATSVTPAVPATTIPGSFLGLDPRPGGIVVLDPDLFLLSTRQYRLSAQAGFGLVLSARDALNGSLVAQRVWVSGNLDDLNSNQFDASLGYARQLNERVSVGGRITAAYTDYRNGRSVSSIGPQATIRAQLSEIYDATAAIGFVRTSQDFGPGFGDSSSIDLALDGSLCRTLEDDRLCARVARRTQSSIAGGAPTSTTAGLDYYRRLSARDTIQLSATAIRSGGLRLLAMEQNSTYFTVTGGYNRQISDRFSGGLNVSYRKLSSVGPDPRSDFSGSLFLRYRLGDLR